MESVTTDVVDSILDAVERWGFDDEDVPDEWLYAIDVDLFCEAIETDDALILYLSPNITEDAFRWVCDLQGILDTASVPVFLSTHAPHTIADFYAFIADDVAEACQEFTWVDVLIWDKLESDRCEAECHSVIGYTDE